MSRYRQVESEKSHKSYQARIWWALWGVAIVVLIYTAWTQIREYRLTHYGQMFVGDYYIYAGEELVKYIDPGDQHNYSFNVSGLDAIHDGDKINMYYWTEIHKAEPHRSPALWVKAYLFFGIAFVLISIRIRQIYKAPYEIYDVREIEQ